MSAAVSLPPGTPAPDPRALHAQIAADPDNSGLHRTLGLALLLNDDLSGALASVERALALAPHDPESHCLLGQIHFVRRDFEAAGASFRHAAELAPGEVDLQAQVAVILLAQKNFAEVSAILTALLDREPDSPVLWVNLAAARKGCGDHDAAVIAYRRAIALQPEWTAVRRELAHLLHQQGRFTEALQEFRTAAEREPDSAEGLLELGKALQLAEQWNEAMAAYERCARLQPEWGVGLLNAAGVATVLRDPERAIELYRRAVALNPELHVTHRDLGMTALMAGHFDDGLREFEWRWPSGGETLHRPELPVPLWDGTPLNGRSLLLWCEQGLGDVIQFARFVSRIDKNGGRIVLHAPKPLAALMATCGGVDQVVTDGEWLDADVQFPLVSLPFILRVGLDSLGPTTYLSAPISCEAAEQAIVPGAAHLNVGCVWKSGVLYPRHRQRDCDAGSMAGLATVPGVRLFSLQFGDAAPDAELYSDVMTDLSDSLGDFATTAAFVERLDLVITVDTAMAHLAGALGKPVWLLLNAYSEWRWMLDRSDSPWYPTMRIYRQSTIGDWTDVLENVRRDLEQLARTKTGATGERRALPPRTSPPKVFVKQYGERRTGTNYIRALLAANYHAEVLMHILGDKHSPPAPFDRYWHEAQTDPDPARAFVCRATFSVPSATTNAFDPHQVQDVTDLSNDVAGAFASGRLRFLVTIRDPYAWAVSLGWYLGWSERGTAIPDARLDELRIACLRFNDRHAAWLRLAADEPGHCVVVRYEDVLTDPYGTCERLADGLGLARRSRRWRDEAGIVLPARWDNHRPTLDHRFESINDRTRACESYLTATAQSLIATTIDWQQIAKFY